ncbi:ABC transporter permease [Microbacterium sp. RU33B]|uniref:ABC transporter permease n=1 Tax=Microbacterium sp. RU33B TaxID=1907390 RepID=UPI000967B65E|nr:ABC transporter permease [Microbacterium sp. RU33B]SIT71635.1 peptide/nickel transport system permease protein [Microbacterium sp. RU33B]
MLSYVLRRIGVSVLILIAASFIMYILVAWARDPLSDLYASNSPNRDQLIAQRIDWLDLDQPVVLRWFNWLIGAAQCVVPFGGCDLGVTIQNQPVTILLGRAVGSTLQLVTASTIFAIVLGILVGIVSALRQYSAVDYTFTFASFFFYSLPSFVMGVLLKVFVALGFNNWLRDPVFSWAWIIILSVVSGLFWQAVIGGPRNRRLVAFAASLITTGAMLYFMSVTEWFLDPSLGPVISPLLIIAFGAAMVLITAGPRARFAWRTAGATAIVLIVAYFVLQMVLPSLELWGVVLLFVAAIAVGLVAGWFLGEHDKGQAMRIGALTGALGMGVIILDQFMQRWSDYLTNPRVNGRPIATVGSQTPNIQGDFWIHSIDTFTHLLLPTISLMLISFAGYTRYARGGMLETLNQDYIRTARAKGLPERTVVGRHAFRNSLIPITTIVAADVGGLIGGAIITERIFAFSGMGALFAQGLNAGDPNPVMAYFIVVAIFAITFNFLADLSYSALDPRVRAK